MSATQVEVEVEQQIKIADMQKQMIDEAIRTAETALDLHEVDREVAKHIKKHFDSNPNWHCLVGKSFTSVVTYESRHYIHFMVGDKSIILFKFG